MSTHDRAAWRDEAQPSFDRLDLAIARDRANGSWHTWAVWTTIRAALAALCRIRTGHWPARNHR